MSGKNSQYFLDLLRDQKGDAEARAILREMHRETLNWQPGNWQETLPESVAMQFTSWVEALLTGKPWPYVLGKAWFFGMELTINEAVLIPRPETEELLEWILQDANEPGEGFLDWCTGSGCLALGLARHYPQAPVSGLDLSQPALEIARFNARKLGQRVEFFSQNALDPTYIPPPAGVWVSNPPYVLPSEKDSLSPEVLDFEPSMALFVEGLDSLLFYKHILLASRISPVTKRLYFELNPLTAEEVEQWARSEGFTRLTFRKDMQGKTRFLRVDTNL
jgi:release factor glutamine methyltransferase